MFDGASNVKLLGRLLKVHNPRFIVMRGVGYTVSLFFNDVFKIPILNQMIYSQRMIYNILVLVCITIFIPFLNPNLKSFTIEILVFLAETILEWPDISWVCTETCGCGKFLKIPYCLHNS